ncbi:MAG: TIGR04551 family protein [Deltaproteobacteria bacterium]|nr:TIGR04551 family protein [Deltaproteobacteria bacterium]
MMRLLALFVLALSSSAWAAAPAGTPEKPEARPAEPSAPATPSPTPAPESVGPESVGAKVEREQLKREVMDEVTRALEKQKQEVRDEVRSQVTTQISNRAIEEEFQFHEEKRKLELFEINGYYRLRPELFYKFDLRRGPDPGGFQLFPRPALDPDRQTLADANMRWRMEPTLNVSEDVRIHAQVDVLDNVILGSTPEGGFGLSERTQWSALSEGQNPPSADKNWVEDSILVRRVYGEVNTPVGQLLFGRMGSQWGMGILANSGNGIDSDYGDTVDRIMFVAKVADHYIVPMLDFVVEGPSSARREELAGQPFDLDQLDDTRDYALAIARRDTDLEITRKLQAGQYILNYGAYFIYRNQTSDAASYYRQNNPYANEQANLGFVGRDASLYIPDLWLKFQTKKLRLEIEGAAVLGSIGNAATVAGLSPDENQSLTLRQFGAAATGSYNVLDNLDIGVEVGFASGDKAAGMGNRPGRGATGPGSIDGAQYCLATTCSRRDGDVRNFRFNRDYRVDLILWRELFDGVTDAVYVKPGAKYEITDGLGIWANVIYSRAIYGESTPSSSLDTAGNLTGDANLGIEIDGGVRYDSGDGFMAGIAYGVLFPLAGLNSNPATAAAIDAETAHTVRGWFVIKY